MEVDSRDLWPSNGKALKIGSLCCKPICTLEWRRLKIGITCDDGNVTSTFADDNLSDVSPLGRRREVTIAFVRWRATGGDSIDVEVESVNLELDDVDDAIDGMIGAECIL